ncbi:uncharacterized protein A4U43_C03F22510 [Asparagus officinalis]|uniref:Protein kinase domain-containing protein n=1 Tax=Asparagus officinalis TaxID=4686 RepID=A0A5P1FD45_ASPOF|nr:lysM domain receptor-like kinase 4 [Asparagus officinalis]ONK75974.1 uncharacterized protein A4U43_C03F22510 [Asparagus officinalis]
MESSHHAISLFFIFFLISPPSFLQSQQPYEGLGISDCTNQHNSTSLLGYFCNGYKSCQSFLTFNSRPPYQSVSSISTLLNSNPSQISQLNSVALDFSFPTNTKVIVPVACSCSGAYYQANSSYVVKHLDTDFTIANNTLQGLSTCQALHQQNNYTSSSYLFSGNEITVPLRCACPTPAQRDNGVKYLLSYLVDAEDTVFLIGQKFGVNFTSILDANGLSQTNANIYPFTTLLIPLELQPNASQVSKPSTPPPPPLIPSSSPSNGKKSNQTVVYVGVGIAIVLSLLILSLIAFYILRKAKKKQKARKISLANGAGVICGKPSEKSSSELFIDFGPSENFFSSISDIGQSLKVYKFEELQLATKNFSKDCKIEGSVYRGVFNGDFAAVKMMSREISTEIQILKKINHFNLIRLSGLCSSHGRWYLVYEYAQNGSLSNWIFDRSGTMALSWIRRVQIALDVANGLNYLHSYTDPPYVHKDVKSSNVLLDGNFRAKVANFGHARAAEGKEGEFELTRHIIGTKGYMAPEYLEHGLVSPKLDVYSFGVVMLELFTGRDASSLQKGEDSFSVKDFIAVLTEEEEEEEEEKVREKIGSFIDPLMEREFPLESAVSVARLIEGCLRKEAASRLNMGDIVQSLSKLFAS